MTDISRHPVLKEAYELGLAIEMLGASEALTAVTIKASALLESIDALAKERDALAATLAGMIDLKDTLAARIPDCPPCDMGENTECVCDAELVPKPWMDEVIKERDGLKAQLALELERRFEGNRIASQETAEEVSALQAEVDRMRAGNKDLQDWFDAAKHDLDAVIVEAMIVERDGLKAEVDRMRGYVHVARVDIRNVCVRLSMDTATDNGRDHLELCRIGKFLDALHPSVNDNGGKV